MKKSWILWSLLGLVLVFAAACKDDDDDGPTELEIRRALLVKQIGEIETHLEQNNINAKMDPDTVAGYGIFREVVQANEGGDPILDGYVAIVNYTIKRLDGTLIGASAPGEPVLIGYTVGSPRYYPVAIRHGLQDVKVGEIHRYYVPSAYGYINYSDGDRYKENGIIILELEIVGRYTSWQEITAAEQEDIAAWLEAENKESQLLGDYLHKVPLTEGSGAEVAVSDSVWVKYKGYFLNKQVFDEDQSGDFDLKVGTTSLVTGFTEAVESMRVGEKSLFIMPSFIAYRNQGGYALPRADIPAFKDKGAFNFSIVPPFTTLIFEIEVVRKKAN